MRLCGLLGHWSSIVLASSNNFGFRCSTNFAGTPYNEYLSANQICPNCLHFCFEAFMLEQYFILELNFDDWCFHLVNMSCLYFNWCSFTASWPKLLLPSSLHHMMTVDYSRCYYYLVWQPRMNCIAIAAIDKFHLIAMVEDYR